MSLPPPPQLARRAAGLLLLTALLVAGAVLYLLHARGVFERTQRLVLVADDAEGVVVGMDLSFSGFPIGRVRRLELGADGKARILVDVPADDAHWLRSSSVFTLERGLVGNTRIRAYSGILSDPPLPDGAVREVLRGDATAEIPRLMAAARELLEQLAQLSLPEGALGATLAQLQRSTERLNGPGGGLSLLLGSDASASRVRSALEQTDRTVARIDRLLARADERLFSDQGVAPQAQASLVELRGLLVEARASLVRLDGVLAEAQAVGANARVATQDLGSLRAEAEANLRQVQRLLLDLQGRWPFAPRPGDAELRLP